MGELIEAFHNRYSEMWGNKFPHLPIMACSYRTSCVLPGKKADYKELPKRDTGKPPGVQRRLSFLPEAEADVMEYDRMELFHGDAIEGPAIIRESMATTVVCLGQVAKIGPYGEIHIEKK